jgi:multicomponent Na+:H+ antiporter subunit A
MAHEPGPTRYYATLLAFMGSMLGVALAADLVSLFLFWELTSVTSFLLIGHYRDAAGQYAARKSLVVTVAGGLFMLVGFLLLHAVSGMALGEPTFRLIGGEASMLANADAMVAALRAQDLLWPVVLLVGVGAAAKSAQFPLHVWLPNAMEAPTPVSAFLHSATMVKAGVYLVGRMRPLLLGEEWTLLFATLGLLTMTITAILAVGAADIKQLLAYSTASHLGLIIAGFGLANVLGAETGAFHIVNHALFKAALFLVAGILAHQAGSRAIADLSGLRRDLPLTAGITVVAALGMGGVPPFNGFYSKELLFEATWEAAAHGDALVWWLLPAVAVFGSIFTFLYSIRFMMLFFGDRPEALGEVHPPGWAMRAPALLLAVLALVVGLGGVLGTVGIHLAPLENFVGTVAEATLPAGAGHGEGLDFSYHLPTTLTPALAMSALTLGLGVLAYPQYGRLRDAVRYGQNVRPISPDWYYNAALDRLDRTQVVARLQTGQLRTYVLALVLGVVAIVLGAFLAAAVSLPPVTGLGLSTVLVIVLAVALVAAMAVVVAPSHIAGTLTLSILGFMVAIFYILARAPDLALTQLVVETLVLVLFLLILDKLPAFYGQASRLRVVRDVVVSLAVGLTVFTTVVLSTAADPRGVIARFFVERGPLPAHPGSGPLLDVGGGGNLVNVILVDFRAFDTLGEISVIAMAALSVITLVAMRERGGRGASEPADVGSAGDGPTGETPAGDGPVGDAPAEDAPTTRDEPVADGGDPHGP